MHFSVQNFRGIAQADIEFSDKITLIAGPNGAGKSSLAESLGACLSGEIIGLKKDAFENVRTGGQGARATLARDAAFRSITWSGGKTTVDTGNGAPYASSLVAGLMDLFKLDDKERATIFRNLLQAMPTRDDLAKELPGFSEDRVNAIWDQIRSLGFDGTLEAAKKRGAELKGAWEQVTKQKFGTTIYKEWQPANWTPGSTEEKLIEELRDAEKSHHDLIAMAAIDSAERAKYEALAADLPAKTAAASELDQKRKEAQARWEEAVKKNSSHDWKSIHETELNCPHCSKIVVYRNGGIHKPDASKPTKAEAEAARKLGFQMQEEVSKLKGEYEHAQAAFAAAHAESSAAHSAKILLEQEAGKKDVPAGAIDQAKNLVEIRRELLASHKRYQEAQNIAQSIDENLLIQKVLSPTGLQRKKTVEKLDSLNARLATLCSVAGWRLVKINEDFQAVYGDFLYKKISKSEQFRVRATLAICWAQADESEMVVIDEADILDNEGRKGLAKLVAYASVPVVLFMTANSSREVPDLSADGRGITYWIANHSVHALQAMAA
jgi:hypothetical protein